MQRTTCHCLGCRLMMMTVTEYYPNRANFGFALKFSSSAKMASVEDVKVNVSSVGDLKLLLCSWNVGMYGLFHVKFHHRFFSKYSICRSHLSF